VYYHSVSLNYYHVFRVVYTISLILYIQFFLVSTVHFIFYTISYCYIFSYLVSHNFIFVTIGHSRHTVIYALQVNFNIYLSKFQIIEINKFVLKLQYYTSFIRITLYSIRHISYWDKLINVWHLFTNIQPSKHKNIHFLANCTKNNKSDNQNQY